MGNLLDCKLAMHVNGFNEIQNSMIHDIGIQHYGGSNRLDRIKSCCHHSLRDLCQHTDGAWQKLKKYWHQEDIGNYPDGCIICLKSISSGCISAVINLTQIVQIKRNVS